MGNAHQTPLGFHFFLAPQVESAEVHVVFEEAEDRLHLDGALRPQTLAHGAGEVGAGLAAVFEQAEAEADLAVALRTRALGLERAGGALVAGIDPALAEIAVISGVAGLAFKVQTLVGRADEFVFLLIVGEVLGQELAFADQFGFAEVMSILVKGVVLEVIAQLLFFEVGVVLFTAIACITDDIPGEASQVLAQVFQMRDQAGLGQGFSAPRSSFMRMQLASGSVLA